MLSTRTKRILTSDILAVPAMLVMLFAARSSLADHYHVPSGSMEYTIMPGDRVLIDKTAYGYRIPFTKIEVAANSRPERGDVAVFDSPIDGRRLIKRIAAIAGDHVVLRDGRLFVNGEALGTATQERFGAHHAELNLNAGGGPDIAALKVPQGMVLALGDHRGNSLDGRYFGLVPESALYGRAYRIYYRRGNGFVWKDL
jgi:signal peptidase I